MKIDMNITKINIKKLFVNHFSKKYQKKKIAHISGVCEGVRGGSNLKNHKNLSDKMGLKIN